MPRHEELGVAHGGADGHEQRVLPQQRHVVGAGAEPPELREAGGAHLRVGVRDALPKEGVLLPECGEPSLACKRPLDKEGDLRRVLLAARGRTLEEERQPLASQRLGRLDREHREHVVDRVGRHLLARVVARAILSGGREGNNQGTSRKNLMTASKPDRTASFLFNYPSYRQGPRLANC